MKSIQRLYSQFAPTHYSLTLEIDSDQKEFTGVVAIDGIIPAEATEIKLHSKDLTIHAASINGVDADCTIAADDLNLKTPDTIPSGDTRLEISFSGHISDAMHGMYPSTFEYDDGLHTLIATQFESHHAREAFPCIDEPEAKATFDLTLVTVANVTVLGNMPAVSSQENEGRLVTVFEKSPRMSTYLLAFVIGNLHSVEGKTKNGTDIRIWATPAQPVESLTFALETAIGSTEFYNDFFDTPYPLPKCDHVALPDFSSAAMENWGLVTYREMALIVDPDSTAIATKEWIATVIAHEISHQWFGNLVTMKWWDDLWLNESFATLMEYLAVDALHPDWDIWMNFTTHEALAALRRDSLPGVQAVKTNVHHPDEIGTLFDGAIVYAKGARLLNMLFRHIGEEPFRKGLKDYFKSHAYSNTSGSDLWLALETASGKPVTNLMQSWLERPGYPIVYVDQQAYDLKLRQERFLISKGEASVEPWPIPLLASAKELEGRLLDTERSEIKLQDSAYVRLNTSASGHYTVRYETPRQRDHLIESITSNNDDVSPSERLLLLNDSIMQARANIGNAVETLRLLEAFENETSEPVWDMISLVISDIRRLIEDDDSAEKLLKKRVADIVASQVERLGWDIVPDEPQSDTKLRATVIGLAIYAEDPAVLSEAVKRFNADADHPENLPPELRSILFAAAIKQDVKGAFDNLLTKYKQTVNPELQQDIAAGLSSTKDEGQAKYLLSLLRDGTIRKQDVDRWFVYLLRNKYSREAAWQWMIEEWQWITDNFAQDKSYDNYPRYAAGVLSTIEWLERYRSFFGPKADQPALTRVIEVGITDIASRAEWRKRDAPLIVSFLAAD